VARRFPALLLAVAGLAHGAERLLESVVPALASGPSCSSTVELANLGTRQVTVDAEGHWPSGALVPLSGADGVTLRLNPQERKALRLPAGEETTGAWVRLRERVPSPDLSPVIAVYARTECLEADRLRSVTRDVAYPTRNPWYAGDVADLPGARVSLINTGERPALATLCYSHGTLYSNGGSRLAPLCSEESEVRVPPFGSREFPVERNDSTWFSLKTGGDSIVLEMLRPSPASSRMFVVDSTIRFGSEVPPTAPPRP